MSPTPAKKAKQSIMKHEVDEEDEDPDYEPPINADDVIVEYLDYNDYIAVDGNRPGDPLDSEGAQELVDLRAENEELRKQLEIYQSRECADPEAPLEVTSGDLYSQVRRLQAQMQDQTEMIQHLVATVNELKEDFSSENTDFVLNFPVETAERLEELDNRLSRDPRTMISVRNRLMKKKDNMRSVITDEVLSTMTISRQYANEHTKKTWVDKSAFLVLIKEVLGEAAFIQFLSKAHHRYKNRRHYDRKVKAKEDRELEAE